jgi:hypothetical protein
VLVQLLLNLPLPFHDSVVVFYTVLKQRDSVAMSIALPNGYLNKRTSKEVKQKRRVFWYKIRLWKMIESGSF